MRCRILRNYNGFASSASEPRISAKDRRMCCPFSGPWGRTVRELKAIRRLQKPTTAVRKGQLAGYASGPAMETKGHTQSNWGVIQQWKNAWPAQTSSLEVSWEDASGCKTLRRSNSRDDQSIGYSMRLNIQQGLHSRILRQASEPGHLRSEDNP